MLAHIRTKWSHRDRRGVFHKCWPWETVRHPQRLIIEKRQYKIEGRLHRLKSRRIVVISLYRMHMNIVSTYKLRIQEKTPQGFVSIATSCWFTAHILLYLLRLYDETKSTVLSVPHQMRIRKQRKSFYHRWMLVFTFTLPARIVLINPRRSALPGRNLVILESFPFAHNTHAWMPIQAYWGLEPRAPM